MKTLFPYVLQVLLISGLLYAYYHLFLRNKAMHRFNRMYLLSATFVSMSLPLLEIDLYLKTAKPDSAITTNSAMYLPETIAGRLPLDRPEAINWVQVAFFIYLLIAALLFTRMLITIIRLFILRYRNPVQPIEHNIVLVQTDAPGTPYSFFRWLFWNPSIAIDSDPGQTIFQHELYHIRARHSADLFYLELLTIICWFNPFFHLIKKETRIVHEFLADEQVASSTGSWQYAELLLMRALNTHQPLVHPFFHSPIKRRIAMLTKPLQTRRSLLRKWMVVPLAFTLVALFSFTIREKKTNANRTFASPLSDTVPPRVVVRPAGTNGATPLTPLSPTTSQLNDWRSNNRYGILIDGTPVSNASLSGYKPYDFSAYSLSLVLKTDPQAGKVDYRVQLMTPTYYKKQVEAGLTGRVDGIKIIPSKELAPVTPDGAQPKGAALDDVLIVIDGVKQPHNASASPLNNLLAPDQIYSVTILKDEKAIQKYGPEATKGVIEIITKEKAGKMAAEKTITQVDQHAHFPGGDTSWRQFLVRTINANVPVDNGAPEGQYKVTVQFIVRSNGQLADIHATTQHGYGMETETIRLLRAGPNWVPAMQNGKAVDSYVQQSVSFVVEGEKEVTRSSQ